MQRAELTPNEASAVNYLFDLAFSDEAIYLGAGDVQGFGPEWPQIAGARASLCRTLAELTASLGNPADRGRWDALAADYESTLAQ